MQYTPTPEQSQLKDSARRYIEKSYTDKARKAALASGPAHASRAGRRGHAGPWRLISPRAWRRQAVTPSPEGPRPSVRAGNQEAGRPDARPRLGDGVDRQSTPSITSSIASPGWIGGGCIGNGLR